MLGRGQTGLEEGGQRALRAGREVSGRRRDLLVSWLWSAPAVWPRARQRASLSLVLPDVEWGLHTCLLPRFLGGGWQ